MWNVEFVPEQASTIAARVDTLYFVLVSLSGLIVVGVTGALLYFAIKYRHRSEADRSNPSTGNMRLEVTWMVVPLLLSIGMFVWAAAVYFDIKRMPRADALEVYAIGKQWMWKFQHPNGVREINALHVPRGRPVKLIMTSQDVIHSFFVPAFRVKQDLVPGQYTNAWFEATKTGDYHLFCAEYCGTSHSRMTGTVHVMRPAAYQAWLTQRAAAAGRTPSPRGRTPEEGAPSEAGPQDTASMVAAGRRVFQRLQCNTCHRVDSSAAQPTTGPILKGLYGSTVTLQNGQEVEADVQYLRTSILYPRKQVVRRFPPIMPTYQGQINEEELMQLVAYLKSLGAAP